MQIPFACKESVTVNPKEVDTFEDYILSLPKADLVNKYLFLVPNKDSLLELRVRFENGDHRLGLNLVKYIYENVAPINRERTTSCKRKFGKNIFFFDHRFSTPEATSYSDKFAEKVKKLQEQQNFAPKLQIVDTMKTDISAEDKKLLEASKLESDFFTLRTDDLFQLIEKCAKVSLFDAVKENGHSAPKKQKKEPEAAPPPPPPKKQKVEPAPPPTPTPPPSVTKKEEPAAIVYDVNVRAAKWHLIINSITRDPIDTHNKLGKDDLLKLAGALDGIIVKEKIGDITVPWNDFIIDILSTTTKTGNTIEKIDFINKNGNLIPDAKFTIKMDEKAIREYMEMPPSQSILREDREMLRRLFVTLFNITVTRM
jgi:hypothetical protein